jgi:hypothetical protein
MIKKKITSLEDPFKNLFKELFDYKNSFLVDCNREADKKTLSALYGLTPSFVCTGKLIRIRIDKTIDKAWPRYSSGRKYCEGDDVFHFFSIENISKMETEITLVELSEDEFCDYAKSHRVLEKKYHNIAGFIKIQEHKKNII